MTTNAQRLQGTIPELAQVTHDRLGYRLDVVDVLGRNRGTTQRAEPAVRFSLELSGTTATPTL